MTPSPSQKLQELVVFRYFMPATVGEWDVCQSEQGARASSHES